ncbi:MAG: HAD hydrolase family protein [Lentisphaerae bacterium]|nr:HAD hydrolase family protein [Lentisphaerota bacterium]
MSRAERPEEEKKVRLRACRLLVLDFDGVLTDNRVYVNDRGEEWVCCSRGDSLGLAMLKKAGREVVVLSTETHGVVAKRCEKLGVACVSGCGDKGPALEAMMAERGLGPEEVAYVGNDVNDRACMERAGVAIAPADAHGEILRMADLTTPQKGGRGAVRQVADWMLETGDGNAEAAEGPARQKETP